MKIYFTLIISILFSSTLLCRTYQVTLVNKKTNQWLEYKGHYYDLNDSLINRFVIITKDNICKIDTLLVPHYKQNYFLDSLGKNGWSRNVRLKDVKKYYSPSIDSTEIIYLQTINERGDSLFCFILHIRLIDLKYNETLSLTDTLIGGYKKEFKEVVKGLEKSIINGKYKIKLQKNTSIIRLGVQSYGLLSSKKYYF